MTFRSEASGSQFCLGSLKDEIFVDGLDVVCSAKHHSPSELVSQNFEHIFDAFLPIDNTEQESSSQKDEVCSECQAFEYVGALLYSSIDVHLHLRFDFYMG